VRAEFVFAAQKAVRARREDILREAILERQVEWELFEREREMRLRERRNDAECCQ
jgi:hypothetical protein